MKAKNLPFLNNSPFSLTLPLQKKDLIPTLTAKLEEVHPLLSPHPSPTSSPFTKERAVQTMRINQAHISLFTK